MRRPAGRHMCRPEQLRISKQCRPGQLRSSARETGQELQAAPTGSAKELQACATRNSSRRIEIVQPRACQQHALTAERHRLGFQQAALGIAERAGLIEYLGRNAQHGSQ